MKYLLRLLILIGVVIGVFGLIGSLLPRRYHFDVAVEIDTPPAAVFEELSKLSHWQDWSPWNPERIEGLTVETSGPQQGKGAVMTWQEPRGRGKLWIIRTEHEKQIDYEMVFDQFPKMSSQIVLTGQGSKTRVRWSSEGQLPAGPFYGYFAPFFSTQMGHEYQQSLERLKEKLESGR